MEIPAVLGPRTQTTPRDPVRPIAAAHLAPARTPKHAAAVAPGPAGARTHPFLHSTRHPLSALSSSIVVSTESQKNKREKRKEEVEEERKAPRGERERERERESVFSGGVDKAAGGSWWLRRKGRQGLSRGELRQEGGLLLVFAAAAALVVELLGRLGFRAPPSGRLGGVKVAPFSLPVSRHLPC
nr:unnamed protein product [Digitaria exilis]